MKINNKEFMSRRETTLIWGNHRRKDNMVYNRRKNTATKLGAA
jgi:hypothetical protein